MKLQKSSPNRKVTLVLSAELHDKLKAFAGKHKDSDLSVSKIVNTWMSSFDFDDTVFQIVFSMPKEFMESKEKIFAFFNKKAEALAKGLKF